MSDGDASPVEALENVTEATEGYSLATSCEASYLDHY